MPQSIVGLLNLGMPEIILLLVSLLVLLVIVVTVGVVVLLVVRAHDRKRQLSAGAVPPQVAPGKP